jgi:hypothetical protein
MEATKNGFIYIKESKQVIASFKAGEQQYFGALHDMFYGTKDEASQFGLIFKDEIQEVQKNQPLLLN